MRSARRAPRGRLVLVRHGESEGNRARVFTDSAEVPLTETGGAQARAAARVIARRFRPRRVLSSPYRRAWQTAEIIAAVLHVPLDVDAAFREQHLGALAGQPYDSVADDPDSRSPRWWEWKPRGGESLADVRRRVGPALDAQAAAYAGADLVLVSHAGVMLALWAHAVGRWDAVQATPNGGILVIEHDRGRYCPPRLLRRRKAVLATPFP